MKNTGKDFEVITQKIYQAIIDGDYQVENLHNIQVQHNVVLIGKSGNTHQIDVYWEFELAGLSYKTIIEVKDWEKPVPQTLLHSFKAVIDDIPGTAKGIFVSRSGFQSGAKVFADANGIKLVQVSKESDDTEISIRVSNITTHYIKTAVVVDEDWCDAQTITMDEAEQIITNVAIEDAYVLNPIKEKVSLFKLMCMDAVPYYTAPEWERHEVERRLCDDWYWVSEDMGQRIKIVEYSFECFNTCVSSMIHVKVKDFPTYCVLDIFSKEQQRYYLSPQKNAIRLESNRQLPMVCL
ncbi:MAG: restriction endonuclease [Ruminococcaceae bacterium]|nr:restriction endonuclease [Oscillospiraceae bacterium]